MAYTRRVDASHVKRLVFCFSVGTLSVRQMRFRRSSCMPCIEMAAD